MQLLLKITVFSIFLIAALAINSEEKDLEQDAFRVNKRERKEHIGTFRNQDNRKIEPDDYPKRYANETAAIVQHGRTDGIRYRSKWLRKPEAVEDISILGYYTKRKRPDNDYNNDYADARPKRRNGGRRRSKNKRRNRLGNNGCQTCGKMLGQGGGQGPNNFGRVIDGKVVQPPFKYPWIVSISRPRIGIICGGAIISSTFILTAAHCVMNLDKRYLPHCNIQSGTIPSNCFYTPNELTLNLLGRQPDEQSQRPVKIGKIIYHPQFNLNKVLHDVALIQVASPIQCNQFASPICLPDSDLHRMGQTLVIAGFGYNTGEGHKGPKLLREGTMKQVRPQVCKSHIREFFNDPNDVICGIGTESRQSSCKGDSGSSIFAKFKNKVYSLGVSSRHTTETCQVDTPVTYAKTFRYMKFIKYFVKDLPGSQGYYSN